MQWWTGNPAPVYALQYFTEQEFEGWNWQHFHDDEFMELLGRVWDESDNAKRAELYVRMQEIMVESGAFVFVANPPLGYLIRDTVDPGHAPRRPAGLSRIQGREVGDRQGPGDDLAVPGFDASPPPLPALGKWVGARGNLHAVRGLRRAATCSTSSSDA